MPQVNTYRVTIVRESGESSQMNVLALDIIDAQRQAERNLLATTDYTSLTVERVRS